MNCAVIVFPGSNCDYDMYHALKLMGHHAELVWHKNSDLKGFDMAVLPGGFSYGDYLRAGAIAHFSPIMQEVLRFARRGKLVMGICNGFQVLTETGLLPGALLRNQNLRFLCQPVYLKVVNNATLFTRGLPLDQPLKIPIAHGEGNYFIEDDGLKSLQDNRQILFRYVNRELEETADANPNGSRASIAGIINKEGNVMGMMPHPERAVEAILGSIDGCGIFKALR